MRGVPSLDLGDGVLGDALLHAHVGEQLLEGVGAVEVLSARVVTIGAGALRGLHVLADLVDGSLVPVLEREVTGDLVEQHGLPIGIPHAVDDVAGLAGNGATGEQRSAVGLVAETLAVLVEPDGLSALHRAHREGGMAAHVAAGANLDLGTDAHGHRDAAAVAARHRRAVLVLAQGVVLGADGVVHLGVRADVAASKNNGVGVDLDVGAVGSLANDARDLGVVIVVHETHGLGLIQELSAGILGLLLTAQHGLLQAHGAAEVGGAHVGGEDALPVVVAVHDGPVEADDVGLLLIGEAVDEPVEGLAGTIGEIAHELRIGAAGTVNLVLVHELGLVIARHTIHVHLPRGVEVTHIIAEDHEVLLGLRVNDDDVATELGSMASNGRASMAGTTHDDMGRERLGDVGDFGLLAKPAGAEHLAHRLALVAGELHAGRRRGNLGCARLGGACRGLVGECRASHGGSRNGGAGAGDKAAARHGRRQRDSAAHLGKLADNLFLVHVKSLSRVWDV